MQIDDREWRDPTGLDSFGQDPSIAAGAWWLFPLVLVVLIIAAVVPL